MSDGARILIAGGGVGGLALAQALRQGGLEVAVYEQDPTPATRNQGYRIHIDANGNEALRACLPAETLDLVRRTSGQNDDVMAAYTDQLHEVMKQTFPGIPDDEITCVDRNTFRRGLLTGLGDTVRFGRTVAGYRPAGSGRVVVEFADGGSEEGDLLVGADGVGSPVRRQLLPHAVVRDLGVRCVYGRMTINDATEALIPDVLKHGLSWIADDTGFGAGLATVRLRSRPDGVPDYLMITFIAKLKRFGMTDEQLVELGPEALWKLTADATADWHPDIGQLIAHADKDTFFPIAFRTSERFDAWESGSVTLLGDAAHTMPPTAGAGANTALQDAATLAGELLSAKPLLDAVAAYERVMLPRGFDNVDNSLQRARQMLGIS